MQLFGNLNNNYFYASLEVLTAVLLKIQVVWDVTRRRSLGNT
jgi:hypothetical protein